MNKKQKHFSEEMKIKNEQNQNHCCKKKCILSLLIQHKSFHSIDLLTKTEKWYFFCDHVLSHSSHSLIVSKYKNSANIISHVIK